MTRRQMLHSGRFSEIEKLGLNISQSPAEAITLDFNGVFVKWNEHTGWGFHHSCSIWYGPLLKRVFCCQLKAELLWWLILRFSELVRNLNISYRKECFMHESLQITSSWAFWSYLCQHSIEELTGFIAGSGQGKSSILPGLHNKQTNTNMLLLHPHLPGYTDRCSNWCCSDIFISCALSKRKAGRTAWGRNKPFVQL